MSEVTAKPTGSRTLVNRLSVYIRRNNRDLKPTLEQKRELGILLTEKFFSNEKHHFLHKVKVIEPEGEFEVCLFPSYFVPVIDAVIHEYFKEKVVVKRKRISKPKEAK